MRAPAPTCEAAAMLDVILGAAVAAFLLVYMTYALLWPEKL
jgi:K+-transporting ATPase KdpF subunit